MAALEAAGPPPDLPEGPGWGVVDEQGRLGEAAHGAGDLVPVPAIHAALAELLQFDAGLGGHEAHRELRAAHLQGEDHRGEPVADARLPADVEREGGLAARGPRGDDPV